MSSVPTVAVPAVALRTALADTLLRPGMILGGKVMEREGAHGLLLLNGVPLVAELPKDVAAGVRLRLQVVTANAERVELSILPEASSSAPAAVAASAVPAVVVALPGGAQLLLRVEPDGGGDGVDGADGGGPAVAMRFDSPTLGRLDLRVDRSSCAVHCAAGEPTRVVRGASGELREAIAEATGRPVLVTVHPRERALDVGA